MARLLFRLNGVTEEEADFVRQRLEQAGVDFYETSQGRWGISLAAIWLRREDDYNDARATLDEIQQDWYEQVKDLPVPSIIQRIRERPASVLMALIAIAAIAGLSILPFMGVFA